jgi:hypothetical protein
MLCRERALIARGSRRYLEAQKMHKSPVARMLAWVYATLAGFTALSVIIPIILDRRARARREQR